MVGFAWNVGHGLRYKVLADHAQRIICRSRLRFASDAENQVEEARRMQPRKERFFLVSKHDFDDPATRLPTLEAFDCPFVVDDDDDAIGLCPTINRRRAEEDTKLKNHTVIVDCALPTRTGHSINCAPLRISCTIGFEKPESQL